MNENQSPRVDKDYVSPEGEPAGDEDDSSPKSYYYDDSTGYEIYNDANEVDDEDEASHDESSNQREC
jgi:hypothetical protein